MPEAKPTDYLLKLRTPVSDLRALWRELVTFEILIKLLVAALLAPLSAALYAWLISLSGESSLSNDRIAAFVFSPLGVLTIALWSIIGFTITLAEQSGLLVIAGSHLRDHPRTALGAILFGLRRSLDFAQLAALQIVLASLVVLPLLAIAGAIYSVWLSDHDINYYLAKRPPKFIAAAGIGAALATVGAAALGWLHLRWLFALPRCVLDGAGARQSLRESWQLTHGRFKRHGTTLLLWLLAVSALGLGAAWLVRVISFFSLYCVGESLSALLPTLAILSTLHILVIACVSFLSVTSYSLLITRLYQSACVEMQWKFADELVGVEARPTHFSRLLTRRRFAFSLAVVFLGIATTTAWGMVSLMDADLSFAVTAHRGSSLRAPENTLAAIELAIAEGADYIEIDVQETSDGHVVMLHDKDFKRLANLNQPIWETSYADLASIDVGSWFDPKFSDQRVPLLSDVIRTTGKQAKLNIELKYNGHDEQLAQRVIDIIRAEEYEQHCVISSLNQEGLKEVRRLAPELKIGLITAVSVGDLSKADVDFLSVSTARVTSSLIDATHRHGKQVHVWTVNDIPTANRLLDLGVDNLLTDDPALMLELRQERSKLTASDRLLLNFRRLLQGE